MKRTYPIAALLPLLLSSCSLAPDFTLPDIEMPEMFKESNRPLDEATFVKKPSDEQAVGSWKIGEPAPAQTGGEWWRVFGDEALNKLQAEALTNNQEVRAMASRVQQARAQVDIATSDAFPSIGASSGVNRYKPSSVIPGMVSSGDQKPITSYNAGGALSFETTLLGGVIDKRRESTAYAESAEASLASVKLIMQADLAQTYFAYRAATADLAVLKEQLSLHEKSLGLLNKKFAAGSIDDLDVQREKVEVEQTRGLMIASEGQRRKLEHTLALLLGKTPAAFALDNTSFAHSIPTIPEGLPSSLLERRPDVIAAQHTLAAANARIGLARAAFFPRLKLTGSGGFESSSFSDVFKWPSRIWSVGPMVTLPIFEGGRNFAELDRSKAAYEEAVANYRQSVLVAFRDVEDSLSDLQTLHAQTEALDRAVQSAVRASSLLRSRYDVGDVSYLEWADARRNELSALRQQITLKRDRLNATVQLIRALGGGWQAAVAQEEKAPEKTEQEASPLPLLPTP